MTIEFVSPSEVVVTIDINTSASGIANLGGYCRYVRMVANTMNAGNTYEVWASPDNILAYHNVYVNTVMQIGAANALYIIFEIGYAQFVYIVASANQAAQRTISLRGYSF